jgi:hypothetical protein
MSGATISDVSRRQGDTADHQPALMHAAPDDVFEIAVAEGEKRLIRLLMVGAFGGDQTIVVGEDDRGVVRKYEPEEVRRLRKCGWWGRANYRLRRMSRRKRV